ncbi:hypothetical protein Nepgr_033932 [Nepenthes gracilis]|uniref:Uncharacterized protein n=1 Tax=Nepenthes gracilis TaxID=150966 RepID=A0AAD3TLJ1_NEPGR|nr:hypothetical protein Nepgr_033932 [Nepenthes gracilis]
MNHGSQQSPDTKRKSALCPDDPTNRLYAEASLRVQVPGVRLLYLFHVDIAEVGELRKQLLGRLLQVLPTVFRKPVWSHYPFSLIWKMPRCCLSDFYEMSDREGLSLTEAFIASGIRGMLILP